MVVSAIAAFTAGSAEEESLLRRRSDFDMLYRLANEDRTASCYIIRIDPERDYIHE